jgi:hypothetical protein
MTKQQATEVCMKVATILDDLKEKEGLPGEITTLGKSIIEVEPETLLEAIKGQIGLERIVKHSLDEAPIWSDILLNLSKWGSSRQAK